MDPDRWKSRCKVGINSLEEFSADGSLDLKYENLFSEKVFKKVHSLAIINNYRLSRYVPTATSWKVYKNVKVC